MDTNHTISSRYDLVNVPSAVWIDEQGTVLRIDEGSYATTHKMGEIEFGRNDYAPMVADWVRNGADSRYVTDASATRLTPKTADQARAEPAFKLGVYFHAQGDSAKAGQYWQKAQALNPDSWNYARQDWSFTPEQARENWAAKLQTLDGKPYYKPVAGLDDGE